MKFKFTFTDGSTKTFDFNFLSNVREVLCLLDEYNRNYKGWYIFKSKESITTDMCIQIKNIISIEEV